MKRRTRGMTHICFLIWFQALTLIGTEIVTWALKPPGNGNWAAVSVFGLLWIKGGMIICAILLTLSAIGIWLMEPLGVILLTGTGALFFLPPTIITLLNFDYTQINGTEDVLIALAELNCFPLFFAGAILYSLWRTIVFRRVQNHM